MKRIFKDAVIITASSLLGLFMLYLISFACKITNISFNKTATPVAVFAAAVIPMISVYIKHFSTQRKKEDMICYFEKNGYNGIFDDLSGFFKGEEYTVLIALLIVILLHVAFNSSFWLFPFEGIFYLSRFFTLRPVGYLIAYLLYALVYYSYLALSRRRFYYSLFK